MPDHKTYFNWSTGKDSALALYHIQKEYSIDLLLTTVNEHYHRVAMHGLREELLDAQAQAMDIRLDKLYLPENPSMETYNSLMNKKIEELRQQEYDQTVFGDIFLEDLKKYRDNLYKPHKIKPLYPIWKRDTTELIKEFIDLRFKAIIVCINHSLLDESYLGKVITHELIETLPENVDPCGENGEFHTFCYDGPIFKHPVTFKTGEKVFRDYPDPSHAGKKIEFGFIDVIRDNPPT